MKTIETRDPNFVVGKSGLRITASDKTVVEFYQGDGIRVVNKAGFPCLEFLIGGKEYSVKIDNKKTWVEVAARIDHSSEYKTEAVELMEAMGRPSKEISTQELVEAFASVQASQEGRINKVLTFTRRSAKLTSEQKGKLCIEAKSVFKEATEAVLTQVQDATDLELGEDWETGDPGMGAVGDPEEDYDKLMGNDPGFRGEARHDRRMKMAALESLIAEAEHGDEDEDDKDKKESNRSQINALKEQLKKLREEDDEDEDDKKHKEEARRRVAALEGIIREEEDEDEKDMDEAAKKEHRGRIATLKAQLEKLRREAGERELPGGASPASSASAAGMGRVGSEDEDHAQIQGNDPGFGGEARKENVRKFKIQALEKMIREEEDEDEKDKEGKKENASTRKGRIAGMKEQLKKLQAKK